MFLAAYVNLASFDGTRGRFSTWLFVIAKNKCINARNKRTPLILPEQPLVVAPTTPHDDLAMGEIRAGLDAALSALPEGQRTAFVLEEFVGLTPVDIAEIEGVTQSTVRSRLSRAKAQLRIALASILGDRP